ncbi:MAG: O-antigen ligase family protein [Elusimicrobia bacterium]|nr:O-antigen ligase family protein [Elusimicrobiota bacterium]
MAYFGLLGYFVSLYIRPQDWVAPFLNMPVDYALFAFVLFFGLFSKSPAQIGSVFRMPHFRWMVFWVVCILASNLKLGRFDMAFEQFYAYFKFLIIFYCFALFIDTFPKLKRLMGFMILLTMLLAIQGIYQKQHGIGWAGQPLGWGNRIKWVGLWDGMNVLCLLFVVSFPFLLEFFSGPWGFPYKLAFFVASPLILFAIYLTNSRGGFMSFLIINFLHFRSRFKSRLGLIAGALLILGLMAAAPSRFGDFNDKERSASHRVDMWIEAFDMVRYNPVLGIGKGNFREYTSRLIAHNSFLEVMGETGMLGLFCWISLLYVSVRSLKQAKDALRSPMEKSLANGLLICIIGYLVTSLFITAEFELLYVLLALSMAVVKQAGIAVRFARKDMRNVALIEGAGMAGLWLVTKVYYRVF